jgi:hypothetical protein
MSDQIQIIPRPQQHWEGALEGHKQFLLLRPRKHTNDSLLLHTGNVGEQDHGSFQEVCSPLDVLMTEAF